MNWIKENKFLAAFLGVMIVGIAVFGFLLYSAWNGYSQVAENFNAKAAELKRLQNLSPYPDEDNLNKTREKKEAYVAGIGTLQKNLAEMQFPLETMEPSAFQDGLRKSVSEAVDKAGKNGVKLLDQADKFYMGFDPYKTSPPKDAVAAAALGRELKAIETIVNILIENKVDAITSITREPLVEESNAASTPSPAGGPKPGAQSGKKELVVKHPFSIGFTAEQGRFRKTLNDIASSKNQIYIVRMIGIKNQNDKGPARGDTPAAVMPVATPASSPLPAGSPLPAAAAAGAPMTTADAAVADAAVASAANVLKFVVGTEKLDVQARIDIVNFEAPTTK